MEGSKRDSLSSIGRTDEKKKRSRRRKLQAGLCSQVEFYFSDANLRKDRFLNQEITKSADRFVPLTMVASFNKIRSLTDDVGIIAKALQKSKLVEVSSDGTQLRRRNPLEEPKYDPDDCTVYVECLPKTADIAWIQKTFKYCGNVVYVSIPRYQSTGDIKGFAFVEYETPEEAQRACQLLNNPLDDYGPPGMFPKTRKGRFVNVDSSQMSLSHGRQTEEFDEGRHHRHHRTERGGGGGEAKDSKQEEVGDGSRKHLKRSRCDDGDDDNNDDDVVLDKDSKRLKDEKISNNGKSKPERGTDEDEKKNRKKRKRKNEIEVEVEDKDGKRKKGHGEEDDIKGREEDERQDDDVRVKDDRERRGEEDDKKSRKRKADEYDKDDCQKKRKPREEEDETEVFVKIKEKDESCGDGFQKDVREAINKTRNAKPATRRTKDENRKKKRFRQKKEKEEQQLFLRVLSKAEWLKLKDQYLHLQKLGLQEMKNAMRAQWRGGTVTKTNNKNSKQGKPVVPEVAHRAATGPEFVEGVVLRIQSTEPIESRKDLRERLDDAAPVAYVDLEDGDTGGFVRFKFQQAAEKILSQEIDGLEAISFTLLTGDEENKYWQKLNADWENKLTSITKKKKKRGKIRVMKRAERAVASKTSSHITFNDDD